MHILSPETDNCPSWISRRERMTVENISWSISTNECCRPRRGLNPRPPGRQSEAHPNDPRGRQVLRSRHPIWFYANTNKRFLVYFNNTDCVWKVPRPEVHLWPIFMWFSTTGSPIAYAVTNVSEKLVLVYFFYGWLRQKRQTIVVFDTFETQ